MSDTQLVVWLTYHGEKVIEVSASESVAKRQVEILYELDPAQWKTKPGYMFEYNGDVWIRPYRVKDNPITPDP